MEEEKLTTANGIINQVGSIVNFAGPILAGVLYGLLGIKVIVVINAISFLMSAILELFLDIPDVVKVEEADVQFSREIYIDRDEELEKYKEDNLNKGKSNNYKKEKSNKLSLAFVKKSFVDMQESFVYLKREKKIVLGIITSYALCNIFLVPILSIVAPYFINVMLNLPAQVYGIVEAICVLGMILGGFWISIKPDMFSMKKVHYTYIPMLTGVIVMAVLGFIKINAMALAGIFALGGMAIMLSLSLSNVLTLTFTQKEVPGTMLGRVSAFSTAVATISVAPGQLLFGQVIELGIPLGIILLATALLNVGLVMFVKWNVREL